MTWRFIHLLNYNLLIRERHYPSLQCLVNQPTQIAITHLANGRLLEILSIIWGRPILAHLHSKYFSLNILPSQCPSLLIFSSLNLSIPSFRNIFSSQTSISPPLNIFLSQYPFLSSQYFSILISFLSMFFPLHVLPCYG